MVEDEVAFLAAVVLIVAVAGLVAVGDDPAVVGDVITVEVVDVCDVDVAGRDVVVGFLFAVGDVFVVIVVGDVVEEDKIVASIVVVVCDVVVVGLSVAFSDVFAITNDTTEAVVVAEVVVVNIVDDVRVFVPG